MSNLEEQQCRGKGREVRMVPFRKVLQLKSSRNPPTCTVHSESIQTPFTFSKCCYVTALF